MGKQSGERLDVSIVIVNYNSYAFICDAIDSIIKNTKDVTYEIIVVDNASSDNSVYKLKHKYEKIYIVQNGDNLGFGRANNEGFLHARGKYIFFLNPDTYLLNDAVGILCRYLNNNVNCSTVGAWLTDLDGKYTNSGGKFPTYYDFLRPTLSRYLEKILHIKPLKNRVVMAPPENGEKETKVDWVIGADLMIRREDFIDAGGFDDDFFMYWEEVYLQYILKKKGGERVIIMGPQIAHLEGKATVTTPSLKREAILDRSMYIFLRKTKGKILTDIFMIPFLLLKGISSRKRITKENIKCYFKILRNK